MLESCQSPFTWKADLPFLWVPWYHIVISSSYHCTIIIIIKSSYNHISMSPSYYRSSQHIISHQHEVMITYFQHKFLQLLFAVYEVPFPFYSECMHELLSFRTAFISCHFFKRVSFTRFKDYRKCCNHIINLTSVQGMRKLLTLDCHIAELFRWSWDSRSQEPCNPFIRFKYLTAHSP